MQATGTTLGDRYLLGDLIGCGGGADVYRADDLDRAEAVAVKVLRAVAPEDLRRFDVEAETLERLNHPAIVRLRDQGDDDGTPYLVLDLVDGEALSSRLERGPLSEEEVAGMGAVLAEALAHAHALGVIHRDVKPGNVLLDGYGNTHITDFGIARLTDRTSITATGLVIGTAAYLAPEQVKGEAVGPATDVYALGLVLLEALTGERAYTGTPSEAALARLRHAPVVPPQTSPALAAALMSMTAEDPARRPTAAEVSRALAGSVRSDVRDATTVLPVMATPTAAVPVPPPARKGRLAWFVAGVALVTIVLLGLTATSGTMPATAVVPTTAPPTTIAPTTAPPTTVAPVNQAPAPPPKPRHKKGDG